MAFCTKCGGANDPGASFCKACGASLAATGAAPSVPPAPPAPPVPTVVVKKSGAGKVFGILFAVLAGLVVIGLVIGALAGADIGISGNKKKVSDPCEDNSFAYLYDLQHGLPNDAAFYWKTKVTPQNLIDVHNFTYVGHGNLLLSSGKPFKVPRVYYQYEVDSSNAIGTPVRKRWNIVMEHDTKNMEDKPCAIVSIEPS